jgi:proteasome lid subunit RPN8/RPN11
MKTLNEVGSLETCGTESVESSSTCTLSQSYTIPAPPPLRTSAGEESETVVTDQPRQTAEQKAEPAPQSGADPTRPVTILASVLDEIVATIAAQPPESGGLLGGSRDEQRITRYLFDNLAGTSGATYSPNTDVINTTLDLWDEDGGDKIIGFIHSHPGGYDQPSPGDLAYAARILQAIPAMTRIFLPIAVFRGQRDCAEVEFLIRPYVAFVAENGKVKAAPVSITIVGAEGQTEETVQFWSTRVASPFRPPVNAYKDETFVRVQDAYDIPLMRKSRIVAVGVGGAAEYIESLARAGIGQFVLIDPDIVSLTNLATQQTYRSDVGRFKVEVLAERLRDINPNVEVVTLNARLDDLDDRLMKVLLTGRIGETDVAPRQTVLCGLTDFFPAQARVNRLALQFGVPSMCAQVYEAGRGAEVTFTHPDITPACHRCALGARFKAYEEGKVEVVGSAGTPIFATTRLNAIKGFVTLALLHAGSGHPRWGRLLEPVAARNLVMIRMSPDFAAQLGLDVFERTFGTTNGNVYFDETIWTAITPDDGKDGADLCPECGGTGCLRDAKGTYRDTITGKKLEWYQCRGFPSLRICR